MIKICGRPAYRRKRIEVLSNKIFETYDTLYKPLHIWRVLSRVTHKKLKEIFCDPTESLGHLPEYLTSQSYHK